MEKINNIFDIGFLNITLQLSTRYENYNFTSKICQTKIKEIKNVYEIYINIYTNFIEFDDEIKINKLLQYFNYLENIQYIFIKRCKIFFNEIKDIYLECYYHNHIFNNNLKIKWDISYIIKKCSILNVNEYINLYKKIINLLEKYNILYTSIDNTDLLPTNIDYFYENIMPNFNDIQEAIKLQNIEKSINSKLNPDIINLIFKKVTNNFYIPLRNQDEYLKTRDNIVYNKDDICIKKYIEIENINPEHYFKERDKLYN